MNSRYFIDLKIVIDKVSNKSSPYHGMWHVYVENPNYSLGFYLTELVAASIADQYIIPDNKLAALPEEFKQEGFYFDDLRSSNLD